ncbi:YfhO family protein [Streptococcus oricebi]|uniref:Copper ABC transporter permease n=1 Tax=Streptococcus oricebi TaxID=1547447 RepID=A0ABS5B6I6_9STRE|nr:YfhO family protein [Streptococcus oricebi]MBP2624116.1 copper ABC transporter permease [Streptococcus oricebi]
MKKIKHFFKNYWSHLLAFLLPFAIMLSVYFTQGIYWNSETSPLLGDGFHQYVIFDINLRNILHGNDSLFYTFTSGLGLNFYALSSYYLGSFLSPLVYFFNLENMPDAVYLFTLIKFGLIGLSSFVSIKGIFKKIPPLLILVLSTSYALMSFATSQIEIKTWLDVFILVPLILYGLHQLVLQKGRVLYFTSLTILFIQNYYFGYMVAIFLVFWYLTEISWDIKKRIKSLLDFTIVSILAGLTSLVMILPTFLDLKTHGEKLTSITRILTEKSNNLDLFAKNFIGSFDTTKYGSIPMIYVGLLPLVLALVFFTLKSIKFHVKLSYLFLITLLIASFRLQALDLFWQGMHAPNMFLHRYSWLFSILVIFLAAHTLNRFEEIKWRNLLAAFSFLALGYLLTFINRKSYPFLTAVNFVLTLEFFLAYLLIFSISIKSFIPKKIFLVSTLFFVCFELSLNTYYQINGIAKEWVFASRKSYAKNLTEIDKLVKEAKDQNKDFYRTEELETQTGNDSMKYNYNGISQFSSVRNTSTSSTLDKLGFKSDGTNLNLRYQNNTILMDSLFGLSYNLSEQDPLKYGFSPFKTENSLSLYQNQNASSLAFLTDSIYKDVKFNNLTLDNQTKFLNQVTGLDLQYFYRRSPIFSYNVHQLDKRIIAKVDQANHSSFASVAYTLEIPAASQAYVNIPNLHFTNDDQKLVDVTIGDRTLRYGTNNVFSFFNLGYFQEKQTVTVRFTFPDNSQVSFDQPEFYTVDVNNYQAAFDKLNSQEVKVRNKNNQVIAQYQAKKDTSLFFTLPYDKGWTASQDGKTLKIERAQKGFMKVDVKKGKGTIKLSFVPQGFKEGLICFILGITCFILYNRKKSLK